MQRSFRLKGSPYMFPPARRQTREESCEMRCGKL